MISVSALFALRVLAGGAGIAHAIVTLDIANGLSVNRAWALFALAAETIGGVLMLLGLAGPIGAGVVAEVLVVVAIVAMVPAGFWDASGRLGYFPALQAMSKLQPTWVQIPLAAVAAGVALLGNGAWSLDGALRFTVSDRVRMIWFGFLMVSTLLVVAVRVFQAPKPI